MSTNARVSSKRFMIDEQIGGSIQKGRNRERTPWQPPLDSAPPVKTDDSEQALDHVPQPLWIRKPQRFRRTLKPGPFLRSAPNRTGTTHPVTHGRRTSTKNNKSVNENGKSCHANFCGRGKVEKTGIARRDSLNIAMVGLSWDRESVAPPALGFLGPWTQRLRAGLISAAPPALKRKAPPTEWGPLEGTAYSSRGLRGTCWEAMRTSPVKGDSAGRRRRASSAEMRTRSGLLFSWETWARTRCRTQESKPA